MCSSRCPLHPAEAAALTKAGSPRQQLREAGRERGKKKIKVKERRRGMVREGGSESCTFLQSRASTPSEGPQPQEPSRALGLPAGSSSSISSSTATLGAAPQPGLAPAPALQVCRGGTEVLRGWARGWVRVGNSNGLRIPSILHNDTMVTVHLLWLG